MNYINHLSIFLITKQQEVMVSFKNLLFNSNMSLLILRASKLHACLMQSRKHLYFLNVIRSKIQLSRRLVFQTVQAEMDSHKEQDLAKLTKTSRIMCLKPCMIKMPRKSAKIIWFKPKRMLLLNLSGTTLMKAWLKKVDLLTLTDKLKYPRTK